MLKVLFFLNEPNGKPWKHFRKIRPGLGKKYKINIEVISKPKPDYLTDDYFELDLPVAPAVMVGDEIVAEGADVSGETIEKEICRQLGVEYQTKKGILNRLFGK